MTTGYTICVPNKHCFRCYDEAGCDRGARLVGQQLLSEMCYTVEKTQSHGTYIMLILVLFLFLCSNVEVHLVRFYNHNNFPAHTHTHTPKNTHSQSIYLYMYNSSPTTPPPPPSPPHTNNVSITKSNTHQNQLQQNNAQWPYVSFGPSGWLNACLWFFVYINWTAAQHFRGHVVGRSVDHGRVNIYIYICT